METLTLDPADLDAARMVACLQGAIVPRPIALASTVDATGAVNLSPFSFFNLFSTRPPILVFSPSRRVRNNTVKHTLENLKEVPEVVINIVSYDMVGQTSLASCEYPKGVDEFVKSGFTPVPSDNVKPPRVGESPAAFECRVNAIMPLGDMGGAGNLVICEVIRVHLHTRILGADGNIDPHLLDAVARMGGDHYCRASGDAVFTVPKPNTKLGIGFDQLPDHVRHSKILTGNELAQLANVERLPEMPASATVQSHDARHHEAKKLLADGKVDAAWQVLLA